MSKPDAILTGDWHLREDQPICRLDDFFAAQMTKLRFLKNLQEEMGCPVIVAGDVFHHWKASPKLLTYTMRNIPRDVYAVWGNHDLPQHSLDLREKSGLETLSVSGHITILPGLHWGQVPTEDFQEEWDSYSRRFGGLVAWHIMTYKQQLPYPGCSSDSALKLLKKYPQFDLIVTGDNHQSFTQEYRGRWLVNPGSLSRQTADQIDHEPCVYLWYRSSRKLEKVPIPIEKEVITRDHIAEDGKNRGERYQAFIEHLKEEGDFDLSFRSNLDRYLRERKVIGSVKQLILEKLEEVA